MSSKGEGTIGLDLDTSNCYVCGPKNAHGLHVPFVRDGENASRGIYTARAEHCGWPGLLHGGVALALMDEALAWALYFQGLYGVTARLEIRFREAIPVGAKLVIRAWTLQQRRRIVNARAEIRRESSRDVLVAEADATMYLQEVEGHNSPAN
ncbi:MAG: PaaI family thioesterase [Acidobacteria bacterium]|nr:PaaI family thioesterase [Acidobacteriota bacterium]